MANENIGLALLPSRCHPARDSVRWVLGRGAECGPAEESGDAFQPRSDAEALVVGKMPMQQVEFHCLHGIEVLSDDVQRDEVATTIDHEPAPGEAWPVFDDDRRNCESLRGWVNHLQKGLEAV